MMRSELKVIGGKQHGTVIPFSTNKFLVGREEDCHLRPNSESISRHHCVFTIDDFGVHLRDLGSTNGTLVNGQRIQGQVELRPRDRITIGKLEFEIIIHETSQVQLPEAASELAESATDETAVSPETIDVASEATGSETMVDIPIPDPLADQAGSETTVLSGDTTVLPKQPEPAEQPIEQQPVPQQPVQEQPIQQPLPQQPVPQQPLQQPFVQPVQQMYDPQLLQQQLLQQQLLQQQLLQQQQLFQQPFPQANQPVAPAAPESEPVRLPDPETTGATEPLPKDEDESTDSKGSEGSPQDNPAADIIRKYLHRRGS